MGIKLRVAVVQQLVVFVLFVTTIVLVMSHVESQDDKLERTYERQCIERINNAERFNHIFVQLAILDSKPVPELGEAANLARTERVRIFREAIINVDC